ncbi:type II secretion system F family protein [Luteococcus sp. Sow4_B9]|uniref:type II secretion system F family protein n=1 Tax=Luteococcus sp. Sow4_B9 TaxID=3438792 RepID=UPI003F98FB35
MTSIAWAGSLLMAAAVGLWLGPRPHVPPAPLEWGSTDGEAGPPGPPTRADRPRRWLRWCLAAGGVVGVLVVCAAVGGANLVCWAVTAAALGLTVGGLGWQRLQQRRADRSAAEVAQGMRVLAAQLRIGAVPGQALQRAAEQTSAFERPAATLAIGGDPAAALRRAAEAPGHEAILGLARAWELCERTGAPIAELAARAGEQAREERASSELVEAELAGPRATARLLALLPLVGIGLGRVVGADPVGFLLGQLPGQVCLMAGVVLACAGVWWTELMAVSARRG